MSHENLSLFPDFQQRLMVLRDLGYVEGTEGEETVTLKGRVSCEMNTCDELLATEAIFGNVLEALNPPEAAALLSAFVFQEKNRCGTEQDSVVHYIYNI
jgi:antiviral helicase SKI2